MCLGVRDPGIAELRSIRVVMCVKPSIYLSIYVQTPDQLHCGPGSSFRSPVSRRDLGPHRVGRAVHWNVAGWLRALSARVMASAAIAANRAHRGHEDHLPGPGHDKAKQCNSFRGRSSEEMEEEADTSPGASARYGEDFDRSRKQSRRFPSRDSRKFGAQPTLKTDVDQSQLSIRNARLTPRYMIDPRYSKFSQHWDLITMFALLFTAIITPYEVPSC